MAMDFSWLPPGQDVSRLPLGMRVNNPGNIKYNPRLGYQGMLGPSAHTDQGDAQMTFDTPQSGMAAAARLAATKYRRGQKTPLSIIAGQGGWTPGNAAAAANVARTMGIRPDEDLGLDDPTRMATFLRALTQQEHGAASKLYGDNIYASVTGGDAMPPAKSMAANLRQRFGTKTEGGVMPQAQSVAAGGEGIDRLKSALSKSYDPDRMTDAESLLASGQKIAGSSGNALGAIGGTILAGIGGYQRSGERENRKAHDAEFSRLAGDASNTEGLMNVMLSSSDPKMREAGIELKAKLLTPKERAVEWVPTADGAAVVNKATGEVRSTGITKPANLPDDVQKYQFDMQQRKNAGQPEIPYADWRKANNSEAAFSKNVIWGVGPDGQPALLQPGSTGEAVATKIPEGYSVAKDPIKLDAGTKYVLLDPQTRQPVGEIPKDIAGEERQKEVGKGLGQAQVDLPRVESNTDSMLAQIDATKSDPYLPSMTGPLDTWRPNLSGDAARVQSKVDQLGGQAFLQAFQSLKGGGAITEMEGAKATAALARLQSMGVNDADYVKALDDFKGEVTRLRDLARQRAAGGSSGAPSTPSASGGNTRLRFNPATGELE